MSENLGAGSQKRPPLDIQGLNNDLIYTFLQKLTLKTSPHSGGAEK